MCIRPDVNDFAKTLSKEILIPLQACNNT
jgi:hypothetical protein